MVDLPQIPETVVTTTAPQSSVSASTVASVGAAQGDALTKLGEGLTDTSVVMAQQDAQKAVTRDADGNLKVSLMPVMTGKASAAYNSAAKQSYIAQLNPEISVAMTKARTDYAGKPQEFQDWASQYVENLAGKQPDDMQTAVRTMAARHAAETYDGLVVQRHNLDVKKANDSIDSQITSASADLESIALQGGVQTDGFKSRLKDVNDLLDAKVKNPLLAYPQEQADLYRDKMMTNVYTATTLDGMQKAYQVGGYQAAKDHLDAAIAGLGGTVKETQKIRNAGLSWIRSEEAGFRGERNAIGKEYSDSLKVEDQLPPEYWSGLSDRARAAGAINVANQIDLRQSALTIRNDQRQRPVSEQLDTLRSGQVSSVAPGLATIKTPTGAPVTVNADAATAFNGFLTDLAATGYKLDVVQGYNNRNIAGTNVRSKHADGLAIDINPDRNPDTGAGGKLITDLPPNVSQIAAKWGLKWGGDFQSKKDAMHFEYAGNAAPISPNDVAARSSAAGTPAPIDLTQSRDGIIAMGMLKKDLSKDMGQKLTDFDATMKKLEFPAIDEVQALAGQVGFLGTPDQKRKFQEIASFAMAGPQFQNMPEPQRNEILAAIDSHVKQGATEYERHLGDALHQADQRITAAYKSDPYGAHYRFAAGVTALPPIDFSAPNASDVLATKVTQQNTIRAGENLPAFSALRPTEATQFAQTLTQGPPPEAAAALDKLASLPPDVYRATLADPPVRDALEAMVRTYDPARLQTAMTTMDKLYQRDPVGFAQAFKSGTLDRLQTWQAIKDTASPAEIAARFQQADDPKTHKAREEYGKLAEKELTSIKVGDVAYQMGNSFGIPLVSALANPITGATPPVPRGTPAITDGVQAGALHAQYSEIYTTFRKLGMDADQAQKQTVERLKTTWGPSSVTDGALMYRPPDNYYPKIDGKSDWLRTQAEDMIAQSLGTEKISPDSLAVMGQTGSPAPAQPSGLVKTGPGWKMRGIWADKQTEAEIAAHQPPSYQVVYTNLRTGRDELLTNPNGGEARIRFNPASEVAAQSTRFLTNDKRAKEIQALTAAQSGVATAAGVP